MRDCQKFFPVRILCYITVYVTEPTKIGMSLMCQHVIENNEFKKLWEV